MWVVYTYIHVPLKIKLYLKMWFSTSFDITWYDEAVICVKNTFLIKKSFSHSIHSWRSLVNDIGEVMKYNWQSMTKLNGVKNAIMQVTYFLNGPMFNLLFYCHIILYWEKVTSFEKFSQNLTVEVQIVWKISVF